MHEPYWIQKSLEENKAIQATAVNIGDFLTHNKEGRIEVKGIFTHCDEYAVTYERSKKDKGWVYLSSCKNLVKAKDIVTVEIWESKEDNSITVSRLDAPEWERGTNPTLLRTIKGIDHNDVMTQHHELMGWEAYKPMEEESC